jgi:protein ImuB
MRWLALRPLHERPQPWPRQAPRGGARKLGSGPAFSCEPAALADGMPEGAPPGGADADPAGPQVLADAAVALAWWALQFTPRVVLLGSVVLLEVSASERLFGGRRQLTLRVLAAERPVARVRITQAGSALLALARMQVAAAAGRDPDRLPLHTLADAVPHLATLERIGCQTWLVLPEVFDMPLELQAQVEAAPALLFAARRLLAQLKVWLQARQQGVLAFELGWRMDARRDTATEGAVQIRTATPTLDMVHLQRLLAENLARTILPAPVLYLRLRTLETVALSGATTSLLPDEQRRGDDLLQLLERLAARLGPEQVLRALPHADHRPECMQGWVPAAAGMPGADAPRSAMASADGSGKQGRRAPSGGRGNAVGADRRGAPAKPPMVRDALYPTWLLATPLRLAVRKGRPLYQGPLTLLVGPQRLEAAWWDVAGSPGAQGASKAVLPGTGEASAEPAPKTARNPDALPVSRLALRDYFLARSEQAGLLWIYRERLTTARLEADKPAGHWYLHGVFG